MREEEIFRKNKVSKKKIDILNKGEQNN